MSSLKDLIKNKRQKLASAGKKERPAKPPQGKSRWRILPSWKKDGDETFFRDFGQHFIKGEDGNVKAVYTCDAVTNGEACDVCNAIQQAAEYAASDAEQKQIKDMRASKSMLFNAIHRDGENPDKVVILGVSANLASDIMSVLEDFLDETEEDPLSLDKGTDVVIERTGSGFDTRYRAQVALKSKPVDKAVLSQLHDLDAYVMDNDEGRLRALSAVSAVTGVAALPSGGSSAAGALTGPSGGKKKPEVLEGKVEEPGDTTDLDDEIPSESSEADDDAGATEDDDTAGAAEADVAMSDEDIDDLLGDLT
jgi:hypothetical protein